MRLTVIFLSAAWVVAGGTLPAQPEAARAVTWEADIAPLLQARCTACHGSLRQRKSLRLDTRAGALAGGRSGPAVVPGDSARSLLLWHVTGTRGKKRMPAEGEPLTSAQVERLRVWIEQGAHGPDDAATVDGAPWAYRPIVRPPVPQSFDPWPRSDLDRLVLARLTAAGVKPAAEADRATWLRRASLDLTGLPPAWEELEAFLADGAADAHERAADRLLASPRYGERWAALWLDLGRYADTKGYEKDDRRTIWRWRDWVIEAFNADLPFDRFTELQLAGDLLPRAGTPELIPTAFHRNTMTNDEGGTDDEEFRVEAVADRVDTTLAVWMGTTIGCARCHDHKYDRLAQREYYQLFAFFNNTADHDQPDERPTIAALTPSQQREQATLDAVQLGLERLLDDPLPESDALEAEWLAVQAERLARFAAAPPELTPWSHAGPFGADSMAQALDGGVPLALAWHPRPDWPDGQVHALGSVAAAAHYLRRTVTVHRPGPVALSFGSDDGLAVWIDGQEQLRKLVSRAAALDQEWVTVDLTAGVHQILVKIANGGGPSGFAFRLAPTDLPADVVEALSVPVAERTAAQRGRLTQVYRRQAPQWAAVREALAKVEADLAALVAPTVPVMRELPADQARSTHVLARGSFLSPGERVTPGVPAVFPPLPADAPANRLGLARWLTSRANPLTARVLANRLWAELFGRGLVPTSDDFGVAGEPPSDPAVLDWLASELLDRQWSIKHLLRTLVTSATYRQSSRQRPELAGYDEAVQSLARFPRVRLSAEAVRDQALAASGLLSGKMFGPSVMPPQPPGLWQNIYSNDQWQDAGGEDRYRRAVYTFWRRTNPYPAMTTFDAQSREQCVVQRVLTNTPLQALVTLNDPAFTEMAQALARRAAQDAGPDVRARVARAFRLCTARWPKPKESDRLTTLYETELAYYRQHPEAALALATQPLGPLPAGLDAADLAAGTAVAQVILNLDEVLTKS